MKLSNLFIVFFLLLTGCGSVQPLKSDEVDQLRSGKMAISVYDSEKTITYDNLTYYGLGIAQTQTKATYAGFFDSEKFIGDLFSVHFNQLRVKSSVRQLPDNLWSPELVKIYALGSWYGSDLSSVENKRSMPIAWREYFATSGYDYVFVSIAPGIRVTATNFDTKQVMLGIGAPVYLYDVKKGILIWAHALHGGFNVPFKDSPKEIENNDFASIKDVIKKSVDNYFTIDGKGYLTGIGVGMGLTPKAN